MNQPFDPARRRLLSVAAGGLSAPYLLGSAFARTPAFPIAETEHGKLRGIHTANAISFKGIPYAANTGGANRFMPPRPVANWAGVRDAVAMGDRCPQEPGGVETPQKPGDWFSWYQQPATHSENCCVLNVYTSSLDPNARRPVMVYIHGGGFRSGGGDGTALEGSNLARRGDVVVVTLNHRLNLFGYLPLGLLDPDFADAGNAGQLDLIAALQWIQRNVAAFGGDPNRVLLFGQSGGGSKIATLMIMPGARGLLHRAVNMSGPTAYDMGPVAAREPVIELFLRNLDLQKSDVRKLQTMPPEQLFAAYRKAVNSLRTDDFRPVVDGLHIPHGPLTAEGLAMHSSIPAIMGTTETEATLWLGRDPRNVNATAEQVKQRIASQFDVERPKADAVYAAYESEAPGSTPYDVLALLTTDALFRGRALVGAEAKSGAAKAPVYLYNFTWKVPVDNGIWKSPHTADIPFAFANADRVPMMTARTRSARQASHSLMSSFVAFARTGNPNNKAMPVWPAYEHQRRATMTIDSPCKVMDDYRGGGRRASETLPDQLAYQILSGPLMRPPG